MALIAFFTVLSISLFFPSSVFGQLTCGAAAEFSYSAPAFCQNETDPTPSHSTGTNGTYSFAVVSGGPLLSINAVTGVIDLSASNPGIYNVTNTVTTGGGAGTLVITGVVDGPLTGGTPKAIEFFALTNIPNLSIYGFSSANNGTGPTGAPEFTFPNVALTAGSRIWVATETTNFNNYFGFPPTFVAATPAAINGDDAIELFCNGAVIDVFGDVNIDGTGQPWDYEDGWAYRKNGTGPNGSTFVLANWNFSGPNALDGTTSNATAPNPWPIGTFTPGATITCTRTVEIVAPPAAEAGPSQMVCEGSVITLAAVGTGTWSGGLGAFSNPNAANSTYTPAQSEINTTVVLTWSVASGGGGVCSSATDNVSITILKKADAEFSYDKQEYCPNPPNPVLSHITGVNGRYTYTVLSGGPTLSLNATTGAINLSTSSQGAYRVTNTVGGCGNLVISGVIDGPITGGLPKAVEFTALTDIPNLSNYGFGSANNGGGTNGQEFTFPAVAVTAGTRIWVSTESTVFQNFFGFPPTFVNGNAPNINGDDAIELFCNGVVIDIFGLINVDGTGQPWEYMDGWVYRKNNTGPDGSFFQLSNWNFSGIDALDNVLTNATAPNPFPINTFTSTQTGICPNAIFNQTITIIDNQPPSVVCPSGTAVVLEPGLCSSIVNFSVTATDNCDATPTVTQVDNTGLQSGEYFPIGNHTLIFEAKDDSGNKTTCTFLVSIQEYPNPTETLTCNDLVNISLEADGTSVVGADDILEGGPYGCYDDYDVDVMNQLGTQSLGKVVNCSFIGDIWTVKVTDPVTGNFCWGQIKVEDKMPPRFINCQPIINVKCTANVNTIPRPTAADNCDISPDVQLNELVITDEEACDDDTVRYRRTYIAVDNYGNISAPCVQIIKVSRPTNVNFPNDRTFSCTQYLSNPNIVNPASAGRPTALDGTYCQFGYTNFDQQLELCTGVSSTFKIVRTWTVLDWCSNAVITSGFDDINNNEIQNPGEVDEDNIQIIMVVDNTPPVITASNVTVSANVYANHPHPCASTRTIPAPTVTDNCSGVAEIKIFTPIGQAINGVIPSPGLPLGTHTINITATDRCGNFTEKQITLTVVDDIIPTTICQEHTEVALSSNGYAELFPESLNNGTFDNCCIDRYEVRRMTDPCQDGQNDLVYGPSVNFCCADVSSQPVQVLMRAVDCFGNDNECMVLVYVQDKLPPIMTHCPANQRITCDWYGDNLEVPLNAANATSATRNAVLTQAGLGEPTFQDNCNLTLEHNVSLVLDNCFEGTIVRQWRAKDPANNVSGPSPWSCTQRIFVDHVSDFVVEFPRDSLVNCVAGMDPQVAFGTPEIFFETCELVAVSHVDTHFDDVSDACYKIVRQWTVINWCVTGANVDQEVVESSEREFQIAFPVEPCDFDGDGDCDTRTFRDSWRVSPKSEPSAAIATQSTNPDTDPDTDPWDGFITYEQIIKVEDQVDPVFTNGCSIPDVEITDNTCSATVTIPEPDINDCSIIELQVTSTLGAPGQFGPFLNVSPGTYNVSYKATDECNNWAVCNTTVKVVDKKKPTPYCKSGLIVSLMNTTPPMVEVWASDLDENSFDNCPGTLKFSFTANVNDKSFLFNCNNIGTNFANIWVTDAAGNQDFCQTTITIQDNMLACNATPLVVGGSIVTEKNTPVKDVEVQLSGTNNAILMTGADGAFQFANVPVGGDYSITPVKDVNPLNGVTTFDLVMISKHILGTQLLDSPYKIIAADANKSNSVTTFDLVAIRKLILLIEDEFPNNTSWRFVPKNHTFSNPANPFTASFPELLNFNNLDASALSADFIGIKVGDVNGNASTGFAGVNEERNEQGAFVLEAKDGQINAGESFTVEFTAAELAVNGFQFSLNFDKDALSFRELVPGVAGAEHFGFALLEKGIITASWNKMGETAYSPNTVVFGLTFVAKKNVSLPQAIRLDNGYVTAEAYDRQNNLLDVQLSFGQMPQTAEFSLMQNTPNPFSEFSVIGFHLPAESNATLTLTDVTGKTVKIVEGIFAKGYHEVKILRKDLPATGVYYYRLEAENYAATKKMVVIE
jgi:hypothetical protein